MNNNSNRFIKLSKLNIPRHFKEGKLYKALSKNNNNNILQNKLNQYPNIPTYFKNEINNIEDLENLLKTYNYWAVDIISKELFDYIIDNKEEINSINKKKGQFLYYSLGYHYYIVTE